MSTTVYLAGGFKSRWQETVKNKHPELSFLDPSIHNIKNPQNYTEWDLIAIDKSDIIFAYMEDSNPGGYALALEIGYAKAKGKTIILIDEHSCNQRDRYFEMVRECSDYYPSSLEEGINLLGQLANNIS